MMLLYGHFNRNNESNDASGHSKFQVWNILKIHMAHIHNDPILEQELMLEDEERRFDFCNYILNKQDRLLVKFCLNY